MAYRPLELQSGTWAWTCGKRSTVILDPKLKRHVVGNGELMGMTPDNYDDYIHNGGPGVSPGIVRHYIEETLLKC